MALPKVLRNSIFRLQAGREPGRVPSTILQLPAQRIQKDFLKEAGCARTSTAEVSRQIATVRTETPYSLEEERRMMGPVR